MNNENNTGFNPQSINEQPTNTQSQSPVMPQQSVQPTMNQQQPTNNSQYMNQTFQQQQANYQQSQMTMQPQGSVQPTMNQQQPTNNSQYMNQTFQQPQPQANYQQPMNTQPKKKNTTLFLIIGVGVLILIAIIVLIVVIVNGNSKGNIINDFENNDIVENEDNDIVNTETSSGETISFKGFTIPKQSGYKYEIDEDGLLIGNNVFATMIAVVPTSLEEVKTVQNDLVTKYSNLGYNPTNVKVSNYGTNEALTMELTMGTQKAIFYVMNADNNYSFMGMAMNPSYTINYNDVETSVSLLSNAKYTNAYKLDTTEEKVLEFKNLFE